MEKVYQFLTNYYNIRTTFIYRQINVEVLKITLYLKKNHNLKFICNNHLIIS